MYRITLMYDRLIDGDFHRSSIKLTKPEYEGLKRLIKGKSPAQWLSEEALHYDEDNFTQHIRDLIIIEVLSKGGK